MKKPTRALYMLLALLLMFSLFAGCGDKTEKSEGAGPTAAVEPTEAPAAGAAAPAEETEEAAEPAAPYTFPLAETREISVWKVFTNIAATYISTDDDVMTYKAVQEKLNIDLIFADAADGAETFNVMIAGGDYCDIIDAGAIRQFFNGTFDDAISEDILMPLNDYVDTCMPDYRDTVHSSEVWETVGVTPGGNYACAYNLVRSDAPVTVGLCIRQDYLDELSLETPATYDEFYQVLKAMNAEKGSTLWVSSKGTMFGQSLSGGYGVCSYEAGNMTTMFYLKDGAAVAYSPLEEGWVKYMKYMHKLYEEGLIWSGYLGNLNDQSPQIEDILSSGLGIFICGTTSFPTYAQQSAEENFRMVALAPPVEAGGGAFHFSTIMSSNMPGWAMSAQCGDPELVACFLNYFYTEEGNIIANYGLEGETFEYVDGKPLLTDLVLANPDGMIYFVANLVYIGSAPCVSDWTKQTSRYTEDQSAAGDTWGHDSSWLIPTYVAMNEEESALYDYADIQTYVQEYGLKFMTGEVDIDEYYDEFVATIQSMGIDGCIAAWQSAVDRY